MTELPSGTVTFLLTDVDASTALWEQTPEAMQAALRRHDAIFEEVVREHGGAHIRPRGEGDSRFAVFASAPDAVTAAVAIQRSLAIEPWPTAGPLRVRIGLHTGAAEYRDGDYYGLEVNRCARVRSIGHGGQILLSEATALLARDALPAELSLRALGEHRLRHLTRPERIFQVVARGLPSEFSRLQTIEAQVGDLPSGGERRDLTVMFADLRGFTAYSEALEPHEVFAALNEYLTVMSDVIYDFQGTLDKFIADAIMAFWGAPVAQQDHAGLACRAALRMVAELDRLNERWAAAGRPPLAMSIGINSGTMLVGNLGSASRFDYAVVGEAVNVGAASNTSIGPTGQRCSWARRPWSARRACAHGCSMRRRWAPCAPQSASSSCWATPLLRSPSLSIAQTAARSISSLPVGGCACAVAAVWAKGCAMTLEQAVAYALDEEPPE